MKVLVTRTDRLGDLVLSLPVLAYIKAAHPQWEVQVMVAPTSVPLVEHDPNLAGVWTWTGVEDDATTDRLESELRAADFNAVLMLQYRKSLATLLRRAGIGRRYGPLSKWSSWLQLNRGTWQSRSRGRRHEMDYSLLLAGKLAGGSPLDAAPAPRLHLSDSQKELGRTFRTQWADDAQTVVFVHPGSGGSALDWDPQRFAGVANALAGLPDWRVFVTGSGADILAVDSVRPYLDDGIEVLLDRYKLREFLGVLSGGDLMIAPSTGPLHMAAALGLATVGVYPPVATMSPDRWGPRGRFSQAMTPTLTCPELRFCSGQACRHYNCMTGIFEKDVIASAVQLVQDRSRDTEERF